MKRKLLLTLKLMLALSAIIFAGCQEVTFKVSFIVDGETHDFINTNGSETIKMPTNPTKEGYEFVGWFWDEGIWEKDFSAISLLETPLTDNLQVYALFINESEQHKFTEGLEFTLQTSGNSYYVTDYTGLDTIIETPDKYNGIKVTGIGDSAFGGCSSLASINIPDSVMVIGNYAFTGCSSLTSINIPDSVLDLGNFAFTGCSSLTSINISDSVTSIGSFAFSYCSSLISVTIGGGVTSIGSFAFSYCRSLTSVTIGDSVKSIASSAFHNCSSLASINITDSVTSIGNSAFSGCSSLTSIIIPDSVKIIVSYAFVDCKNLIIYAELETKPDGWFEDWNNLSKDLDSERVHVVWNYKQV